LKSDFFAVGLPTDLRDNISHFVWEYASSSSIVAGRVNRASRFPVCFQLLITIILI